MIFTTNLQQCKMCKHSATPEGPFVHLSLVPAPKQPPLCFLSLVDRPSQKNSHKRNHTIYRFFVCLFSLSIMLPLLRLFKPSVLCVQSLRVPLFEAPMKYSPPSSRIHGIFQARILERVAISLLQGIFPTQG